MEIRSLVASVAAIGFVVAGCGLPTADTPDAAVVGEPYRQLSDSDPITVDIYRAETTDRTPVTK
jgi:hypothetical protein